MNQTFENMLLPGEKLLWSGRTEVTDLMEPPFNRTLLIRWIVCAVIGIGLSVLYVSYVISRPEVTFYVLILVFTLGAPLYAALQPVFDKRQVERKGVYAITNSRVITYCGDTRLWSMSIDNANPVRVETLSNGLGVVYIGEAFGARSSRSRTIALLGLKDEDFKVTGLVFYAIKDAEEVKRLLNQPEPGMPEAA